MNVIDEEWDDWNDDPNNNIPVELGRYETIGSLNQYFIFNPEEEWDFDVEWIRELVPVSVFVNVEE